MRRRLEIYAGVWVLQRRRLGINADVWVLHAAPPYHWEVEVVVQPGEKGADYGRWEGERPLPRRVGGGGGQAMNGGGHGGSGGDDGGGDGRNDGDLPRTYYVICRIKDPKSGCGSTSTADNYPPASAAAPAAAAWSSPGWFGRSCGSGTDGGGGGT